MPWDLQIGGRTRQVVVAREGDGFAVTVDGHAWRVDAVRVGAQALSLIVDSGPSDDAAEPGAPPSPGVETAGRRRRCYDVTIARDIVPEQFAVHVGATSVTVGLSARRRRRGREEGVDAGSGPQRITAPMPGRIVRVLVRPGDAVRARQGLAVIEAMKMENELRAGRDGTVAEVHAREGASVEAGALLLVIA